MFKLFSVDTVLLNADFPTILHVDLLSNCSNSSPVTVPFYFSSFAKLGFVNFLPTNECEWMNIHKQTLGPQIYRYLLDNRGNRYDGPSLVRMHYDDTAGLITLIVRIVWHKTRFPADFPLGFTQPFIFLILILVVFARLESKIS